MSDSGLDAYDKRDVFIGNRKSSDRDSRGYIFHWRDIDNDGMNVRGIDI